PHLVIIDGLDECSDSQVQCEVLDVILSSIYDHHLPFIFLITSRPEHELTSRFNRQDMDGVMS
ncbi:hypothetical protein CPB84DRAFT_1875131, partial [Gymnopilus junonius]